MSQAIMDNDAEGKVGIRQQIINWWAKNIQSRFAKDDKAKPQVKKAKESGDESTGTKWELPKHPAMNLSWILPIVAFLWFTQGIFQTVFFVVLVTIGFILGTEDDGWSFDGIIDFFTKDKKGRRNWIVQRWPMWIVSELYPNEEGNLIRGWTLGFRRNWGEYYVENKPFSRLIPLFKDGNSLLKLLTMVLLGFLLLFLALNGRVYPYLLSHQYFLTWLFPLAVLIFAARDRDANPLAIFLYLGVIIYFRIPELWDWETDPYKLLGEGELIYANLAWVYQVAIPFVVFYVVFFLDEFIIEPARMVIAFRKSENFSVLYTPKAEENFVDYWKTVTSQVAVVKTKESKGLENPFGRSKAVFSAVEDDTQPSDVRQAPPIPSVNGSGDEAEEETKSSVPPLPDQGLHVVDRNNAPFPAVDSSENDELSLSDSVKIIADKVGWELKGYNSTEFFITKVLRENRTTIFDSELPDDELSVVAIATWIEDKDIDVSSPFEIAKEINNNKEEIINILSSMLEVSA